MILRLVHRHASSPLQALWVAGLALGCAKNEPNQATPTAEKGAPGAAAGPKAPALPPLPTPPRSLGLPKVPRNNPTTSAKVRLGQQLFFDPALSVDGTVACVTCHRNEDGTGGHDPLAIGAKNTPLPRHAPVLWNVAYMPKLNWDGGADSLEAQAKSVWADAMGVGQDRLSAKADEIGVKPAYKAQFAAAFPGIGATPDSIAQAISAYERTLYCGDTKLDRHLAGDASALDEEQKAGLDLFIGKAACHSCHTPPFFSDAFAMEDGAYHNVGVGTAGKDPAAIDAGRQRISENPSEWAAFKTPSLRNVTRSAPYLHDGSLAKLEDTVRFMAAGGRQNPGLDPKMVDKHLSDDEIKKLVAFLGSLECTGTLEPPPSP